MDKGIPYYIFHVLNYDGKYQAWIANKRNYNGKIKVENYLRTLWLSEQEFDFSFSKSSIDGIYSSLKEQVEEKRKSKTNKSEQLEECSAFMHYFHTMKMTRSYKPVLILAAIQAGGSVTVEQALRFFIRFYQNRKLAGLTPEKGNCTYVDEPENLNAIYRNLICKPIDALCHSGFFEYDAEKRIFSFSNDIYDGLTLDEIEEISNVCNIRLKNYFNEQQARMRMCALLIVNIFDNGRKCPPCMIAIMIIAEVLNLKTHEDCLNEKKCEVIYGYKLLPNVFEQ